MSVCGGYLVSISIYLDICTCTIDNECTQGIHERMKYRGTWLVRTIKDKLNKYLLSREVPTISDAQLQVLQMREKENKEYLLSVMHSFKYCR